MLIFNLINLIFQYRRPVGSASEDSIGGVSSSSSGGGVVTQNSTTSSPAAGPRPITASARDYVESLHQNNKNTLLYGKNNVQVQPVSNFYFFVTLVSNG